MKYYPWPRPCRDGINLGPIEGAVEIVESFWTYADCPDRDWAADRQEEMAVIAYPRGDRYTVKRQTLLEVPASPDSEAAKLLLKKCVAYQLERQAVSGHLIGCEGHESGLLLTAVPPRHWWGKEPWVVEYLLKSQDEILLQKTRIWAQKLIMEKPSWQDSIPATAS